MIDFAEDIKNRVQMKDVLELYGIPVNRQGKALCPFHDDRHASLHVYPGRRGWYCFVCDKGGDVIDFVRQYFGLDFQAACEKINADMALGLPLGRELSLREMRAAQQAIRERREKIAAEKAAREKLEDDYHRALDWYARLDRQRLKYAPEAPERPVSDFYAEAVKNIDAAREALDEAEMRLYLYDNRSGYR